MEKSFSNFLIFFRQLKTNINDFLSSDVLSSQITQTTTKLRRKRKCKRKKKIYKERSECSECNKIRIPLDENNQICYTCNKAKKRIIPSGNKVIDDFIRYTQTNYF